MCGGPVHMAEIDGIHSLCGRNLSFSLNMSQPLSFPYGSYAITCKACEAEFLRREKTTRSLNYYCFIARRDEFLDDLTICREEYYTHPLCAVCIKKGEGTLSCSYADEKRYFLESFRGAVF